MRLPILLIVLSCLAFIGSARAEDAPPVPPGATAAAPVTTPAQPQPGSPSAAQPAPVARKEEDETAPANGGWSLRNLGAYLKSKGALADAAADKDKQIAALTARISALESGAELKAAREEAAALRADLEGFALFAQTHGLLKEDGTLAAAQSPAGQAAGQAVAAAVSRNLSALGVPVAQMPASAAKGGADVSDEAIQAVIDQMHASTDAGERGRLAEKLKAMRAAQAKAKAAIN